MPSTWLFNNNRYGVDIKYQDSPMIVHVDKKRVKFGFPEKINIVPELCRISGVPKDLKTDR